MWSSPFLWLQSPQHPRTNARNTRRGGEKNQQRNESTRSKRRSNVQKEARQPNSANTQTTMPKLLDNSSGQSVSGFLVGSAHSLLSPIQHITQKPCFPACSRTHPPDGHVAKRTVLSKHRWPCDLAATSVFRRALQKRGARLRLKARI